MALYLDASCLVPLVVPEPSTNELTALLEQSPDDAMLSDYGLGEAASAVSRKVREGRLTAEQGLEALRRFDEWVAVVATLVESRPADVRRAAELVRRFELKLRLPDALHIALCDGRRARLVTRDVLMAEAADALGMPVLRLD